MPASFFRSAAIDIEILAANTLKHNVLCSEGCKKICTPKHGTRWDTES